MTINILGTPYEIITKKRFEDKMFENQDCDGYTITATRKIVLCDLYSFDRWKDETEEVVSAYSKQTLRHEIVHAFLAESGLCQSSNETSAWAINEEMVDWIALQGDKIHKAWKEADAI